MFQNKPHLLSSYIIFYQYYHNNLYFQIEYIHQSKLHICKVYQNLSNRQQKMELHIHLYLLHMYKVYYQHYQSIRYHQLDIHNLHRLNNHIELIHLNILKRPVYKKQQYIYILKYLNLNLQSLKILYIQNSLVQTQHLLLNFLDIFEYMCHSHFHHQLIDKFFHLKYKNEYLLLIHMVDYWLLIHMQVMLII